MRTQKVTMQNSVAANANGTTMNCQGVAAAYCQVKGSSFAGTVNFEETVDGDNWVGVQAVNLNDGSIGSTSVSTDGIYAVPTFGAKFLRARVSGYDSGTVTVTTLGADVPMSPINDQSVSVSGNVDIGSIAAGTTNIGDVDVASIAAGNNNIGDVDVASIASNDGVDIGDVDVASIAAGTTNIGDVDVASIAAGETHLGQTGGETAVVRYTPAITSGGTYTAGDAFGGRLEFADAFRTSGGSGYLISVTAIEKTDSPNMPEVELNLFSGTFTATVDDSAFDPDDDELASYSLGKVHVYASDYAEYANNAVATVDANGLTLNADTGTTLYGQAVIRDADTFSGTADFTWVLGIMQD